MLVEDNIADFYQKLLAKSGIQPQYPLYKRLGGPDSQSGSLLIIRFSEIRIVYEKKYEKYNRATQDRGIVDGLNTV
jgi:hypothetical protein